MLTFQAYPRAGLVGPMFVGQGDLVTEAGGIIFGDGSAANYGRGREPHHSLYFMHKADYVSAACVVFPKEVYKAIGGFDPQVGRAGGRAGGLAGRRAGRAASSRRRLPRAGHRPAGCPNVLQPAASDCVRTC